MLFFGNELSIYTVIWSLCHCVTVQLKEEQCFVVVLFSLFPLEGACSRIMVREIVSIQVGQCGNQIGNAFWEEICTEHDIDTGDGTFTPSQSDDDEHNGTNMKLEKLNVYFEETAKQRYVPRSVLVDLEPGVLDLLRSRPIGKLFKPDNFIFAASGGANNWAKTHYNDGPELIDQICDVIRQCMEGADCPQGLQLSQSLGGGTGSGLGSLILLKLRFHFALCLSFPSTLTLSLSVSLCFVGDLEFQSALCTVYTL